MNKFVCKKWRHLLAKIASNKVTLVMVSTHGSVVPLSMFVWFCVFIMPLLLSWDSTWEATGYNTYPIPMQTKTRMRALKKTMTVVFVLSFPSKQTFILFPAFHRPCKKDLVLHPLTFDNAVVCQMCQVWYCSINTGRLLLFVFCRRIKRETLKNRFFFTQYLSFSSTRKGMCYIHLLWVL